MLPPSSITRNYILKTERKEEHLKHERVDMTAEKQRNRNVTEKTRKKSTAPTLAPQEVEKAKDTNTNESLVTDWQF